VKAARRFDFDARLGDGAAVVAPNSARTKEDERREEAAAAEAASAAAAAAEEAVALATAKGRRAKARAEVYERTREELHDLGLGSSSRRFPRVAFPQSEETRPTESFPERRRKTAPRG
jgi:hypothetical protein